MGDGHWALLVLAGVASAVDLFTSSDRLPDPIALARTNLDPCPTNRTEICTYVVPIAVVKRSKTRKYVRKIVFFSFFVSWRHTPKKKKIDVSFFEMRTRAFG